MAEYIVWRPEYSVANESLDHQHRGIIGIINNVFLLVKNGESERELETLLENLYYYTTTHFAYEEQLMRLAEYPDVEAHCRAHEALAHKTSAFCGKKYHAEGILPSDVLDLLKDWWVNHIRTTDSQYAPFVGKLQQLPE